MNHTELQTVRKGLGLSQAKLAELSKIPQYLLSAHELGKAELPPHMLAALQESLADKQAVTALASRRKRYQIHEYREIKPHSDRAKRAAQTEGNVQYLAILRDIAEGHARTKGEPVALSLFSGCGGFSLGFSAAGFKLAGFLELNPDLRKIYKDNFPSSLELGGDITGVTDLQLEDFARRLGRVDAIVGGPPCQGFSLSGKRDVSDPRNTLFKHYLRFVDSVSPKVAILENVRLLTSMKSPTGSFVKDDICAEFEKHGYKVRRFEVNAKDYGIPQHRERVLFVAVRSDLKAAPSLPDRTHGQGSDLFTHSCEYRTFADACSDLPFIESGGTSDYPLHEAVQHPAHVIEWLWDVPEGSSAHENADARLRPPSGYNTTYKRQVWLEPASTVQTTFGMISGCRNVHPIATRSLTVREAARIQSFPDTYRFSGSLSTIRTGIGNAVPPLLAYVVARHVRESLL
jgi:DNA (cytosine-5)-methyltransferase 1